MRERQLTFRATAPSNIALIKYMGKSDASANVPENTSLSMTLDALRTHAELERHAGGDGLVRWAGEAPRLARPIAGLELLVPALDDRGAAKVERHARLVLERAPAILARAGVEAATDVLGFDYALRAANTFPAASGIASSASSFAAVTLAAAAACARDAEEFARALDSGPALRRELAALSRLGSGSSCRSFEGPWVRWQGEDARGVPAGIRELAHFVIVVSSASKAVSSSEAHARVKTSPLWLERQARIEKRAASALEALDRGDLPALARVAWLEAWEMHSLFHTSREPFSYWEPGTIAALQWLAPFVRSERPPLVTLDAGPNIHVTVEASEAGRWAGELAARFGGEARILRDRPGAGAVFEGTS